MCGSSNFQKYYQYKNDFFNKLGTTFDSGKTLLDVGCGDGSDAEYFIKKCKLTVTGIDVYKHEDIDKITGLNFKLAGILKIPFEDDTFDYVYLHDVLHHIDEQDQSYEKHIEGLKEVKRVTKSGGKILIAEGNRYNPLFYPHMVKMLGHDHFKQAYFIKIIQDVFPNVRFNYFEAHVYPQKFIRFWKLYEFVMERFSPKQFLAYNVAVAVK